MKYRHINDAVLRKHLEVCEACCSVLDYVVSAVQCHGCCTVK